MPRYFLTGSADSEHRYSCQQTYFKMDKSNTKCNYWLTEYGTFTLLSSKLSEQIRVRSYGHRNWHLLIMKVGRYHHSHFILDVLICVTSVKALPVIIKCPVYDNCEYFHNNVYELMFRTITMFISCL